MFEKITDFDGKQFLNLWGGFSCECFADGINTFVMFYIKDKEVLSLSGNDANDVLDFVLSEYYENENSTIEDGFSTWLMGHYDNVIPTFDGIEPKFREGDWILYSGDFYEGVRHITKIDENGYYIERNGLPHGIIPFSHEICMRLWTIQDAKDGDVLFQDLMDGKTFIYNGVNPDKAILYSFIISNDGKDVLPYHIGKPNTGIGNIEENINIIHPATKEQRDTLFAKMHEAGYDWDNEKKELKKIIRQNTTNKVKSKENKPRYDIGDVLCTTFNKETKIEYILTTDDVPLSVLYKTFLKDRKRQNRIIEKQKKEIKKLKDKINKLQMRIDELSLID